MKVDEMKTAQPITKEQHEFTLRANQYVFNDKVNQLKKKKALKIVHGVTHEERARILELLRR